MPTASVIVCLPRSCYTVWVQIKKRNEIWVSSTHSSSESMLCHCLSTLILIRIMWFYKVAVRSKAEGTNLSSCLMSRCIVTTDPKAGSLIGGPDEYWVVRERVISEYHLSNDDFAHACTHAGTHTHTHTKHENKMSKVEQRLHLQFDKWNNLYMSVNSNIQRCFVCLPEIRRIKSH